MKKIFNISASNCFVKVLAQTLLEDYKDDLLKLSEVVVLLPNRRACRSLADAFVELKGMRPTLLPQIRAVGDVNEDELVLCGQNVEQDVLSLPSVVEPLERTMLFMRLIMGRYGEFGLEKISLAQACSLALELGRLIDTAGMYGLDWQKLENLAPDEYAAHWQETLKFLQIITKYWPHILRERGVIDAFERKNLLVEKQSIIWDKQKPKQRIIIAGTTAVSPAMKKLVETVLALENGEVWIYGLDKFLSDDDWQKIDETHPQFELKQLLDFLQIDRTKVLNKISAVNEYRERLISEVLRPAQTTEKWRNLKLASENAKAVEGLKMIECEDQRTEALTIALIIRKALRQTEKKVALITPDRVLARWVASDLQRWGIDVDDSAGVPLAQTRWGIFMRLCVAAMMPGAGKDVLLALMKNELFSIGKARSEIDETVCVLDKEVWRLGNENDSGLQLLEQFKTVIDDWKRLLEKKKVSLAELLRVHIVTAENLAGDDIKSGAERLWGGADGEAGAGFLADFMAKADILGEIDTNEYLDLFEAMMLQIMVRSKGNSHKRVRILGPMEARLNQYDEMILGGFNEGVWPVLPSTDPWMSRPMKKDFGLELPEKQIGVLGLDFACLVAAENVWITRAKMNAGTPSVKSRWWMRLETVLKAVGVKSEDEEHIAELAVQIEKPDRFIKIEAPAPRPPVKARPRRLSASAVEMLMRDPYGIYAKYILQLFPLNELDPEPDGRDLGNLVHKVLEVFGRKYDTKYPDDAEAILKRMVDEELQNSGLPKEKVAFWYPKMMKMMEWVAKKEKEYRKDICKIYNEIWGSFYIEDAPAGRFEIFAKADRVDVTAEGKVNIIDYKTGGVRKESEVRKGYAPQLPIEGIVACKGGFDGIEKSDVAGLMYWKLGDKEVNIDKDLDGVLEDTEQRIAKLVNLYDFETTGYLSRPNPKCAPEYSDYEHLARVKEWSVKDEGEE